MVASVEIHGFVDFLGEATVLLVFCVPEIRYADAIIL